MESIGISQRRWGGAAAFWSCIMARKFKGFTVVEKGASASVTSFKLARRDFIKQHVPSLYHYSNFHDARAAGSLHKDTQLPRAMQVLSALGSKSVAWKHYLPCAQTIRICGGKPTFILGHRIFYCNKTKTFT